jgi:hypothetical protein
VDNVKIIAGNQVVEVKDASAQKSSGMTSESHAENTSAPVLEALARHLDEWYHKIKNNNTNIVRPKDTTA